MAHQMDLFKSEMSRGLTQSVEQMIAELEWNGGWMSASTFKELFGWSSRRCRLIAEYSDGRILGGNGGYILTVNATDAEFKGCNGRIRSQGEKMVQRARREQNVRDECRPEPSDKSLQ